MLVLVLGSTTLGLAFGAVWPLGRAFHEAPRALEIKFPGRTYYWMSTFFQDLLSAGKDLVATEDDLIANLGTVHAEF